MSGLAGIIFGRADRTSDAYAAILRSFETLMMASAVRGEDASGLAVLQGCGRHTLLKRPVSVYRLMTESAYAESVRRILRRVDASTTLLMGHARDADGASPEVSLNNEPIRACQVLGAHDGVVVEPQDLSDLWDVRRHSEGDGEVLYRLADSCFEDGSLNVERFVAGLNDVESLFSAVVASKTEPSRVILIKAGWPIEVSLHPDLGVVAYASDRSFLDRAASERAGWKPLPIPDRHRAVFAVRTLSQPEMIPLRARWGTAADDAAVEA